MQSIKLPLLIASFLTVGVIQAAVIVGDARLVTGTDQIDPAGARNTINLTTDGTGVATKAGLIAVDGYATVQSFTGLDASVGTSPNATGNNIFTFTDRPDMRISFLGEPARNAGSGTGGAAAYTSGPASPLGGESIFFGTSNQNVMTLEFGTYANDVFSADVGVAAVGFTFARNTAAAVATVWSVSFFNGATELATQTVNAGTAINVAALFGLVADPGEQITRVTIGGVVGVQYDNKNHFVDDVGFAAIPEPSATGLLAGFGALALVGLRRRRA